MRLSSTAVTLVLVRFIEAEVLDRWTNKIAPYLGHAFFVQFR